MTSDRDVADLKQRWTSAVQPEQSFERDRVIEVAADLEEPAPERVDP